MQSNITFRKATLADFNALFTIWTQGHVNAFMTFEIMSKHDFLPIFEKIFSESDIYVLEKNGQVIATRRIISRQGEHAHTVEFASFGIDQHHLKKGYGKLFYDYLINELKKTKPHVTRIELIQETDNIIALSLAEKMGFSSEVTSPDWINRKTGLETYQKKWRVGARLMAKNIYPEISPPIRPAQSFNPELPPLKNYDKSIKIEFNELKTKAFCYDQNNVIAICLLTSGNLRLSHIQFWEIQLIDTAQPIALENFLRELATLSSIQFKKIDLSAANKEIIAATKKLGFHCRGIKSASRKIETTYYDELSLDIGFFNIEDAKSIIEITTQLDNTEKTDLIRSLINCHQTIIEELKHDHIDQYAALYLENLAFQIIRENHTETRLYNQHTPWLDLIEKLPLNLHSAFIKLMSASS